jgi:chromate reductase, NAD(P)H dehydrogenase (quinone)
MPATRDIAILVGSLRRESRTRLAAKALIALAPAHLDMRFVEIGDLPLYNQDLEKDSPPVGWTRFRADVKRADAVLFMTPEYNRSVPGALKNAIDVGSRPSGASVFQGKPAAVMSVTLGGLGAFGANHHLRQSLVFLNMPTMQAPEAYISKANDLFDEQGALKDDKTRAFFTQFIGAFADWIERVAPR